jgi:hypothetical protein
MSKKTVITVAITFVATTILWIGVVIGLYWFYFGSEPPFRVALNHPAEVALGSEFAVAVAVENSSDEPATLGSIDIYNSLLDGFELISSRPAFVGVDDVLNFQTLWYQAELQPDSPRTFTLTFRATRPGRHGGQLDVCTPTEVCTTVYATIAVGEGG